MFRNSADNSAQTIPKRRSSGSKIVGIFQINTKRTQCTKKAAPRGAARFRAYNDTSRVT